MDPYPYLSLPSSLSSTSRLKLTSLPNDILLTVANHLRLEGQPESTPVPDPSNPPSSRDNYIGPPNTFYHSPPLRGIREKDYLAIDEYGRLVKKVKGEEAAYRDRETKESLDEDGSQEMHWEQDLETEDHYRRSLARTSSFTTYPGSCCKNHEALSGNTCALGNLMRVNQILYGLIQPVLYQEVGLLDSQLGTYLSSLEKSPLIPFLTRKLVFRGHKGGSARVIEAGLQILKDSITMTELASKFPNPSSGFTSNLTPSQLSTLHGLRTCSLTRVKILERSQNLERLVSRGMEGSLDGDELTRYIADEDVSGIKGLTTLTSISLSWSATNPNGFTFPEISPILLLPNLYQVEILGISQSNPKNLEFFNPLENGKGCHLVGKSNVKSLKISGIFHWSIRNEPQDLLIPHSLTFQNAPHLVSPMIGFLQITKNLINFEIKVISWGFHGLSLHAGLAASRNTLKSLSILGVDPEFLDSSQDPLLYSLKLYRSLKSLQLTQMHFLAGEEIRFLKGQDWLPFNLPITLESLILVRVSNWDTLEKLSEWMGNVEPTKTRAQPLEERSNVHGFGMGTGMIEEESLVPRSLKKIYVDKVFLGHFEFARKENKMGVAFKKLCAERGIEVAKC